MLLDESREINYCSLPWCLFRFFIALADLEARIYLLPFNATPNFQTFSRGILLCQSNGFQRRRIQRRMFTSECSVNRKRSAEVRKLTSKMLLVFLLQPSSSSWEAHGKLFVHAVSLSSRFYSSRSFICGILISLRKTKKKLQKKEKYFELQITHIQT